MEIHNTQTAFLMRLMRTTVRQEGCLFLSSKAADFRWVGRTLVCPLLPAACFRSRSKRFSFPCCSLPLPHLFPVLELFLHAFLQLWASIPTNALPHRAKSSQKALVLFSLCVMRRGGRASGSYGFSINLSSLTEFSPVEEAQTLWVGVLEPDWLIFTFVSPLFPSCAI